MRRFLLALGIFLLASPVHAAIDLDISDIAASVHEDQEFPLSFSLSQSISASNPVYLRVVIYQEGTTKYFGYTQNKALDWINTTSDKSLFFELAVSPEGTASGELKGKFDLENSYYNGAGVYKVKLGRYTSSSDSGADWSNELEITHTTNPSPTPTPTPTLSPSPASTSTPTPSSTPTSSSEAKTSPLASSLGTPSLSPSTQIGTVAGLTVDSIHLTALTSPLPSPSLQGPSSQAPALNHTRAKTALLVGLGLITISTAGFFGLRKFRSINQL
jgi:hypothetical protein